jgi:recombination protein RecT
VVVHDGDKFDYEMGLTPKLFHKPMPHDGKPKLTHVYFVASFPDGRKVFDIMTRAEVEERRARSKAQKFTPWNTDYDAMAMKTVIRRGSKFLPMSAEINTMIGLDDKLDANESQENAHILAEGRPIHTKGERIEQRMEDYDPNFDK